MLVGLIVVKLLCDGMSLMDNNTLLSLDLIVTDSVPKLVHLLPVSLSRLGVVGYTLMGGPKYSPP